MIADLVARRIVGFWRSAHDLPLDGISVKVPP